MFCIFALIFTKVILLFNPLIQFIMGKVVGLIGAASGKIGNIVYAVTNGIQVARVYQPVVSNPKSSLQNVQRAKGNLAGRMSSFVPRTAIMGLGNNNRMRRGEFLRNLLKEAVVSKTAENYEAKIKNDKVIFSKGHVTLSVFNPSISTTVNTVDVTVSGVSIIPVNEYEAAQTRLVVMVYDSTTYELIECVTKILTKPQQGATATTQILINNPEGFIADVYAIPMSTMDGSAVTVSTDMANLSDDDIAALLSVNKTAVVFEYGKSVLLGQSSFTPAP